MPDPEPAEALNAEALLKAIPRVQADPSAALEPLWARIEKILEAAIECVEAGGISEEPIWRTAGMDVCARGREGFAILTSTGNLLVYRG